MKLLLVSGAVFLLAGDIVQAVNRDGVAWTILLAIAFLLLAPGLTLVPSTMPRRTAPVVGAALAVAGAIAGASMQVLFRVNAVLRGAGQSDAVAALGESTLLTATTLVPGILFPLGLLLLAFALRRSIGRTGALLLAAAAVMFPIGHAAGVMAVAIVGDVVLLIAFWMFRA